VDLSQRSTQAEVMDAPDTSPSDYARCLHDLESVNRLTMTHRPTLRWLSHATRDLPRGAPVSILDVACGAGDLLRAIDRWAERSGLHATLTGIDLNPGSAIVAAAQTAPGRAILYRTGDVFDETLALEADFIVSSQFAHHLDDAAIVRFLLWLDCHARRGWFIADLHRHLIPYLGFRVLGLVAGWHRIVRSDGTISIARAFRRADWLRYLALAGFDADIHWLFAFRLCVGRLK
jgi:2-polyprenyl-3-methyl-5-hydroxy-6-metoxy-1,4-benzoquinol methylase